MNCLGKTYCENFHYMQTWKKCNLAPSVLAGEAWSILGSYMLKRVLSEYWWHRGDATAKNISYQQPRCPPQADGHYLQPAACQGRFMALGLPGSWQKGFLTQPESMLSLLLKQPCLYRFQKSKKEMEGSECISHF